MSNDIRAGTESRLGRALRITDILHLVVTITLGWALVVKLTPPDKPVENGLELLFPGVVILLLGVPFALVGVALIQKGMKAVKLTALVDVAEIILLAGVFLLIRNVWIAIAALPFAVDAAVLMALVRKLS